MAPVRPCDVCAIPSTKTCSSCKSVFYCSVDHQKLFWCYHRLVCGLNHENFSLIPLPAFQIEEGPDLRKLTMKIGIDANPDARRTLLQDYQTFSTLTEAEKILAYTSIVAIQNDKVNSLIPKERNGALFAARNNMTLEGGVNKLLTNHDHVLSSYYTHSNLEHRVYVSTSQYHYSFLKEYRTCLQLNELLSVFNPTIPTSFSTDKETFNTLQQSLKRLRKFYFELKKEGKDKGNIYRRITCFYSMSVHSLPRHYAGLISIEQIMVGADRAGRGIDIDCDKWMLKLDAEV